ncbi:TAP42-like protein [Kockovaella imperatae]|uniref:TAP42-like protein n=1 Tax=Kockovaella imperatae TaxID=4999 RepID=A0A1Y1U8J9_9TREE|nr:TAP42-like protein [Kockovaella imperatae]ORX34353.1 TAP42-like protein [Kockovaella imperatae]
MSQTDLPLPVFYSKTLSSLLPIFDDSLSLSDPNAVAILSKALEDLHLIARMITSLGVFSDNESVEELGNGELVFMSLGWVIGEAESKGGLGGIQDRLAALKRADHAFNLFLSLLSTYSIVTPSEQAESSAMGVEAGLPRDPAKRREAKIAQYKREKQLREQISTRCPGQPDSSSNPLSFILSLLPSSDSRPSSTAVNAEEDDQRTVSLSVLQLLYTLTLSSLASIKMELDILASAPPEPTSSQPPQTGETDNTWRLDRTPASHVKPRQLISGGGRVLRPFTILPSTIAMSDRERLRSEVFRSGHRLPTMTIDEYLEEEQARGNIITGGGQASADAPTESELLQLAAEEDGTMEGDAKAEQKRLKDENWAQYAEANPRGAGNRMNRG